MFIYLFFNEEEQSLGKGSRDDPRWQARLQAVSMGKHWSPSAKVFSRPHPTLTPVTLWQLAWAVGRRTLQKKGWAEQRGVRISNLSERLSPVGDSPAPTSSKGLYMCIKFASDLKQK